MNKHIVEFDAGYYEWLIYVDGIVIYFINDANWEDYFTNKKELKFFVKDLVFSFIEKEASEDNIEGTSFVSADAQKTWKELSTEEKSNLADQIISAWERYI